MIKYQAVQDNKRTNLERAEDLQVISGKKLSKIESNLAIGETMDSRKIIKTIPLCIKFL